MDYKFISESKTGLRRIVNQDSLGIHTVEEGLLVIVCDGIGGNNAGEIASEIAVKTIYNYFKNSSQSDYLDRIKSAIELANSELRTKSYNNPEMKGMATTAEVFFIKDYSAYWGHIGDSRIYLSTKDSLKQLTKDHSLVQQLVDEGQLTLKEAENHPNKNVVVRALGKSPVVEIDLSKTRVTGRDNKFLICSDGLNSVINDDEIKTFLDKGSLDVISKSLTRAIELKGAPDNYTFVVIAVP